MKILILENEQYQAISKDMPVVGKSYLLEDATFGTGAQNRAFHSVLDAFWVWMHSTNTFVFEDAGIIYDLSTPDPIAFKDFLKYKYGEGFTHYQYVNDLFEMVKVEKLEEIPEYVIVNFNAGNKGRVKGVLKSWTAYSLRQRMKLITLLIHIITISGCDDKKVIEIIEGMEWKQNEPDKEEPCRNTTNG